jgi:hypothetical protein
MTTVEEIASAINRLNLVDRMRVIEQVVHAMTSAMQEKEPSLMGRRGHVGMRAHATWRSLFAIPSGPAIVVPRDPPSVRL